MSSSSSGPTPIRMAIGGLAVAAIALCAYTGAVLYEDHRIRTTLYDLLETVPLKECAFERLGRDHDGGYVVCGNLLDEVEAVYSYGINGEDSFGCDAAEVLDVDVHQYDCFNTTRYPCDNGRDVFHEECVGAVSETLDGRAFDSVVGQIERTGHAGEHVLVKMDVEGAEVESLLAMSAEDLASVDQLVLEVHSMTDPGTLEMVRHLAEHFHVADVHFNNFRCEPKAEPFPGWVYEVLFVNKSIDEVDPEGQVAFPNPAWMPNTAEGPDCQAPMVGR